MRRATVVRGGWGAWSTILVLGGVAVCAEPADSPFAPLQTRLQALADRLDPERNFGHSNATDFRGYALSMLLDYGQELRRGGDVAHEDVLAIAERQCRALEKVALGIEDRSEAPFVFHEGTYLGLVNNEIGLLFRVDQRRLSLEALYHCRRKHQFLRPGKTTTPLWELECSGGSGRAGQTLSGNTPAKTSAEVAGGDLEGEIRLCWRFEQPRLDVRVTLNLQTTNRVVDGRLEIMNRESAMRLGRVTFPRIGRIALGDETGEDFLALPRQGGRLWTNPGRLALSSQATEMQFMVYYTGQGAGLLLQAGKSSSQAKDAAQPYRPQRVRFEGRENESEKRADSTFRDLLAEGESGRLAIGVRHATSSLTEPGETRACYARLGCFSGEWYDGAQLYRSWALKQSWAPHEPLWARRDVPVWFKQNCLVVCAGRDFAIDLELVNQHRAKLDAPALIHWIGRPDGDRQQRLRDPPLTENTELLRQARLPLLADVRALVWDSQSGTWNGHEIEAAAMRDEGGKILAADTPDASLTRLCPAHSLARQKCIAAILSAVQEYGLRGVCINLDTNQECFSSNHGHPPGDGCWLVQSQRKLLVQIRAEARKLSPQFVLLVGGNDERFLDVSDGYRTSTELRSVEPQAAGPDGRRIPLFQAVYGDHCIGYGFGGPVCDSRRCWASRLAQSLAWGQQIVASCPADGTRLSAVELDAVCRCAVWRKAALPYLAYGRMLQPPEVLSKSDGEGPSRAGLILAAAWQTPGDAVALVFVRCGETGDTTNHESGAADRSTRFEARVDWAGYGVAVDGSWQLCGLSSQGEAKRLRAIDRDLRLNESLEPWEVRILLALPGLRPQ